MKTLNSTNTTAITETQSSSLTLANTSNSMTSAKNDNQVIHLWFSDKSKTTIKTYECTLRQFYFYFGECRLGEVTIDTLVEFKEYLCNKNYKDATINNKLMAIKSLLSFAYKIGYIHFNVGLCVKSLKMRESIAEKILSPSDIANLINGAKNQRDKLTIKVLANTGLRISELINLKWTDINNGKITVFGKGNKTRFLPIKQDLLNELIKLKTKHCEYIFYSNRFTNLKRENVHTMLKATAKRVNLTEKVSCHWFRHSVATHALKNGASLPLVKEMLGHGNINTTARYLHCLETESALDYISF